MKETINQLHSFFDELLEENANLRKEILISNNSTNEQEKTIEQLRSKVSELQGRNYYLVDENDHLVNSIGELRVNNAELKDENNSFALGVDKAKQILETCIKNEAYTTEYSDEIMVCNMMETNSVFEEVIKQLHKIIDSLPVDRDNQ